MSRRKPMNREKQQNRKRKKSRILLLLILSLTVLSGCASNAEITEAIIAEEEGRTSLPGTAVTLLASRPALPPVPDFPSGMDWGYSEELDLYTLPADDCDRLLNYRDVELELYKTDLALYEDNLNTIVAKIEELNL